MITHPSFPARRGAARATTWWGKAWVRAVEEAAYAEADLRRGRALARGGQVGGITVSGGRAVAAVREGDDVHTVTLTLPVFDDEAVSVLVYLVASEAGRVAELLAGDLPITLVEQADESGVELLPYAGDLDATCTCDAWMQPCPHALAVCSQLAWLVDGDPLVLLHLRGLSREDLLGRLAARTPSPDEADPDLDTAYDAALRAARILETLDDGGDVAHLL